MNNYNKKELLQLIEERDGIYFSLARNFCEEEDEQWVLRTYGNHPSIHLGECIATLALEKQKLIEQLKIVNLKLSNIIDRNYV